jgi:hypothetical protein
MTAMLEPFEKHPPTEGGDDFVRMPRDEDAPEEPRPGLSPSAGESPPDEPGDPEADDERR